MQSGAPPASSSVGTADDDDFHWDAAAEAELQAIEAAYAAAKRRRLPDWSSPSVRAAPPEPRHHGRGFPGAAVGRLSSRFPRECEGKVSLGFDLEWRPFPRRGDPPCKVAVMQLCMEKTHCYVMHIFHSGVPSILKSLLEDSSSIKVGIWIDNDARKMLNDYDVHVQPLMDLSYLANAKLDRPPKRWSLASLTETITCRELPKPSNIRMGNWEANVLSKQQLQYAATDAYISWHLYEVLRSLPDNNIECSASSLLNQQGRVGGSSEVRTKGGSSKYILL
ncbi:hypothetical protein GUJ93_ZPchr0004g38420 [Zizania palustris]|uniref:3'-5' exonuclease domain-containing protein n=1 Tax=Zizania palustris TaxID=103762 RepID=A0A8J5SXN7_ZIZPA|nr:hypothetical protein GUJ93_ZPchr0004g38420 [Zizania palustris]